MGYAEFFGEDPHSGGGDAKASTSNLQWLVAGAWNAGLAAGELNGAHTVPSLLMAHAENFMCVGSFRQLAACVFQCAAA